MIPSTPKGQSKQRQKSLHFKEFEILFKTFLVDPADSTRTKKQLNRLLLLLLYAFFVS